eukprot:3172206-Prymnesium_polylepis.1
MRSNFFGTQGTIPHAQKGHVTVERLIGAVPKSTRCEAMLVARREAVACEAACLSIDSVQHTVDIHMQCPSSFCARGLSAPIATRAYTGRPEGRAEFTPRCDPERCLLASLTTPTVRENASIFRSGVDRQWPLGQCQIALSVLAGRLVEVHARLDDPGPPSLQRPLLRVVHTETPFAPCRAPVAALRGRLTGHRKQCAEAQDTAGTRWHFDGTLYARWPAGGQMKRRRTLCVSRFDALEDRLGGSAAQALASGRSYSTKRRRVYVTQTWSNSRCDQRRDTGAG